MTQAWYRRATFPFRIRIARHQYDLDQCLAVRRAGYRRHFKDEHVPEKDHFDTTENTHHLIAEDFEGRPLGTLRILTWPEGPLEIMNFVDLPTSLLSEAIAEGTRMAVVNDAKYSQVVKYSLCKAMLEFCLLRKIGTILAWVRKGVERDYLMMRYQDISQRPVYFSHPVYEARHRVLYFPIAESREIWRKERHPLYQFAFESSEPLISVGP